MKFDYQARTKEGQLKVGQVEASSREAALDILQQYGYFITYLEEHSKKPFWQREITLFDRVTREDIVNFTRQLAIMLLSETPPVESLHTLASQAEKEALKTKITRIANEVEAGKPFSEALSLYPDVFSDFYVNMVKSGEASGDLPGSLETLADHMERQYNLFAKMRSAAIYPAFVVVTMVVIVILMLYFVFPQLEKVFDQTGKELPAVTTFMLGTADFLRSWGWLIFLLFTAAIAAAVHFVRTPQGKRIFDELILQIPVLGPLFKKAYLSRFAENLSTLISGGLPIAQALQISGEVVGNSVYKRATFAAPDGVRRGENISSVLKQYPEAIPPLVTQMIFVGERTGRLDEVLGRMTTFYQQEVDRAVDRFISLLEPVLIVLLGAVVAFIVLTILLPIYQIGIA